MIQDKIPQKPKKPDKQEGFTMLEVLFSILIIFAFLMGALQAMVYAAVFRVKALEKSEATTWIQQDLEYVRYEASQLAENETLCSATSASSGYANALKQNLNLLETETKELLPNKTYTLTRTFTPSSTEPYDILEINYMVTDPNGNELSTIDTEVIPDAAFNCT